MRKEDMRKEDMRKEDMRVAFIVIVGLVVGVLISGCADKEIESLDGYHIKITSTAFSEGGKIPKKYTCEGEGGGVSPPLSLENVPEGTKSLVILVEDPDAPLGTFVHWVVWNIPPTDVIGEGSMPEGAVEGKNGFGNIGYGAPCPPTGTHRYIFRVYALNSTLELKEGSTRKEVWEAMKEKGNVIAHGALTGLYR